MSATIAMRSFAKINLGLRIGAARSDGFHDLVTVYQTIALHDVVRVKLERGRGIEIRCADPRVPKDESNTCFRIVEKAMASLRAKGRVVVEIEKRLPVQGGLGGASGNAVATLLGLERALGKSLSAEQRLRIAAEVGSDLPLFLVGGTVLGVGRGEQVYPVEDLPAMPCVVATPEVGVSTPKAFAEWDRMQELKPLSLSGGDAALKRRSSAAVAERGSDETSAAELRSAGPVRLPLAKLGLARAPVPAQVSEKLTVPEASDRMGELGPELSAWLSVVSSTQAFSGRSFSGRSFSGRSKGQPSGAPSDFWKGRGRAENPLLALVRAGIENDFEQVVFPEYPELGKSKRALVRAGAKYASLSGSGSTLYGLFASREVAEQAAAKLRKQGWIAQATTTLTRRQYWRRMFAG